MRILTLVILSGSDGIVGSEDTRTRFTCSNESYSVIRETILRSDVLLMGRRSAPRS